MIKYIFFDVSGTILGKPTLFQKIQESLNTFGFFNSSNEIKLKHKLLSEVIHFPDRTDKKFYDHFNSELLRLLGIIPSEEILDSIFKNCTYLPWEKFEDTSILSQINLPMGIISNFNNSLNEKLNHFFGPIFKDILVSEDLGIAKPQLEFYDKALERIGHNANEVLYIGDSLKLDIEPATLLGMQCLLIDRDNFYQKSSNKIEDLSNILQFI
ncbi:HAD family hydrolase [Flavobacterium sp. ACN6]|uniref:HAD family hydrolase n=1 Tax=Flavobacterium sp. ACN6 TaxID=1920426 RepID=UPI000BB3B38D|nr:HAD family hydrolase [Flavobacterium sp. ACN6]PBJ13879.1 putative HAD-hydrolase YfnB [Flavobacterium sp. ACN6]